VKLLIAHVFATKRPLYLVPNYLHLLLRSGRRIHGIIKGVGAVKRNLFVEDGFDGVELEVLSLGVIRIRDWQIDTERFGKILKQKMPIESVHAAFLPEQLAKFGRMINGLNPAFRSENVVNGLLAHIELASLLACDNPIMVLHPGIVPDSISTQAGIDCVVENVKEILPALEKTRVTICLENLGPVSERGKLRVIGGRHEELLEMVERINHPQVKIAYDWGHANCMARKVYQENKKNLPKSYLTDFTFHHDFVKALGKHIVYLHLNFNPAHLAVNFEKRPRFQGWDFHQGLDRADSHSLVLYKQVMRRVFFETAWRSFGAKALLELNPLGIAKMLHMGYMGSSDKGALSTAHILRSWFHEFEQEEVALAQKKIKGKSAKSQSVLPAVTIETGPQ
jgi:hypothetical protein